MDLEHKNQKDQKDQKQPNNQNQLSQSRQIRNKIYSMDETTCLESLLKEATLSPDSIQRIQTRARDLVYKVRQNRLEKSGLDAFLQTYDLSSEEGVALMCLAEALLRIPDADTRDRLIKDKISTRDWEQHLGKSHSWFVNAATWGLMLTGRVLNPEKNNTQQWLSTLLGLTNRVGEPIIRRAVVEAMKILGRQFVMGETIESALERAVPMEEKGYRYSYDMLGEAAKTATDAAHYFKAYKNAIQAIAAVNTGDGPIDSPGISVKLSALHPRYEWVKRQRSINELLPKLKELCLAAKTANIGLTIDAEEADRLELSLMLIEALVTDPELSSWQGFGAAVQAYQKRSFAVIEYLINLAKTQQKRLMIRLVKGAYWDSEIKWSQEKGYQNYPVFTRKSSTDVSYLACAKKLFEGREFIYPQFATHNAYTLAAVLEMADNLNHYRDFEFQCLHGMGDSLYDNIVGDEHLNIPCRVYAPVGGHEHLLAYLVRRLLENGANTSFVNRILDEQTSMDELIKDPVQKTKNLLEANQTPHPAIPRPPFIYGKNRPNSIGINLSNDSETIQLFAEISSQMPSILQKMESGITKIDSKQMDPLLNKAVRAAKEWEKKPLNVRSQVLNKMAMLLEEHKSLFIALLVREGGKTVQDALSEVREAIDFCWYYSERINEDFQILQLPGPTGEHNQMTLRGRGVIACISPWNFPLAIFLGQVTAALASGNAVIAKPASQTPLIAYYAIELLHQTGIPTDLVQLWIGKGSEIGNVLADDKRIAGIMFTGSTETARGINQRLANRAAPSPIVPFIAETGGQNAMIVDSSALPEQVVTDVITSSFNSAGQRCSALRVLFLQSDVAEQMLTMLKGAMAELKFGDPLDLSVDIGPVIDQNAHDTLMQHVEKMKTSGTLLYECALPEKDQLPTLPRGVFFAPRLYEIKDLSILTTEVFGPILHVIRYEAEDLDKVIDAINNTGYGLTLGIHSRINETVEYIHERAHVGNTYVNRNMIGAVVGVQPFGGEGLSGTGPKAGGPHILQRLVHERTLSVNIAATGGNVTLMSLQE